MKFKTKATLFSIFSLIGIMTSQLLVGFSAFTFQFTSGLQTIDINLKVADFSDIGDGIYVSNIKSFNIHKPVFEDPDTLEESFFGLLKYTIKVEPNKISERIKGEVDPNSNKYNFVINARLSLTEEVEIFNNESSNNTYLDNITWCNESISYRFYTTHVDATLDFEIEDSINEYTLIYKFNNKFLRDCQSDVIDKYFSLKLYKNVE